MNARTTVQDFAAMRKVFPSWNAPLCELPLHFTYAGQDYCGMPANTRITHELTDTNIFRATYTAILEGGLEVKLVHTEYRDYPVREWIAYFTNVGQADTPILENAVIGGTLPGTLQVFDYSNGDTWRDDGYEWFEETFAAKDSINIFPVDGTSCNGASPYMKLRFVDYGLRIGIGWSGMWNVSVTKAENSVIYTVGQKRCHMILHPGETIRTPMLSVLAYTEGEDHGRNLWRRWFIDHILPRENGEPIRPHLCMHNFQADGHPEFTGATEENQCRAIREYLDGGLQPDVWWIDAGWHPCNYTWWEIGTWEPDPVRFPRGLAPIGEMCEKEGMRLLLWFEPERVRPGSWIYENHPEWLLTTTDPESGECNGDHLLNYANPEALEWVIEHVNRIVQESHVGVYRQDFNISPSPARGTVRKIWEEAEAEDRVGAIENLHIQGYLRFWDELLLRNPGLWIDSCASGGRRNDLDTMRRAVSLHYTDIGYGNHPIKQKQHRMMFEWMPYFRAHNMSWDNPDGTYGFDSKPVDEFAFHCAMTPALTAMTHYQDKERYAVDRKMVPIWREAAALMLSGDYYPLTECRKDAHDWYAMQFDNSENGTGFVQVVRNVLVEEDTYTVRMHADAGMTYTFTDKLTSNTFTKTAEELAAGFDVTLPKRSGLMLFYTYA